MAAVQKIFKCFSIESLDNQVNDFTKGKQVIGRQLIADFGHSIYVEMITYEEYTLKKTG